MRRRSEGRDKNVLIHICRDYNLRAVWSRKQGDRKEEDSPCLPIEEEKE